MVLVMKPIFEPKEYRAYVLYPYRIFHVRLSFKRIVGDDRVMDFYAYVDCYRGVVERGDGFIDLIDFEAEEERVMEHLVDYEDARRMAIEKAVAWGNLRAISWWLPKAEVVREAEAYKVFWIFGNKIMDSLTGEVFEGFL